MKKCSRCHAENFEDQKFCNLCGRELTARIALDLYAGNPPPAPKPVEPEEQLAPETRAYQHFLAAKDEIARRNLDGAIREFRAALKLCPGDQMIERLLKKTEEARERAMAVPPRNAPRTLAAMPARAPEAVGPAAVRSGTGPAVPASALSKTLTDDPAAPSARARARTLVSGEDVDASAAYTDEAPRGAAIARSVAARKPAGVAAAFSMDPSGDPPPRRREGSAAPPLRPATGPAPAPARAAAPEKRPAARHAKPEERTTTGARALRSRAAEEASASRVAPHTGRFLELYDRSPNLSPAMALDGRTDEGMKEVAVNLLILGGFLLFGFLLLL